MKALRNILLITFVLAPALLLAQKKKAVRVYLSSMRDDSAISLSTRVLYRPEKRYLPLAGVPVKLFAKVNGKEEFLATIKTNMDGTGFVTLTNEASSAFMKLPEITYLAKVEENDSLTAKTKKIKMKPVFLDLELIEENEDRMARVHVFEYDSAGNKIPVANKEIGFYVDRPLSPFQFNKERLKTDENGMASSSYGETLPGDESGKINILAKIVDDDDFGTVETARIAEWGKPIVLDHEELRRSLWASGANAPIALLIFINSLIAAVWGMIIYIVVRLFRIKSLGARTTYN